MTTHNIDSDNPSDWPLFVADLSGRGESDGERLDMAERIADRLGRIAYAQTAAGPIAALPKVGA